jgi:putative ATP-binding cassette transporter
MRLFALLRRESPISIGRIAAMAALSGIVNAALLGVINAAAGSPERQTSTKYLVVFCVIILLFIVAQQYILQTSTLLVETVLNRVRQRIVEQIREADLGPLESLGRAAIYTAVAQQVSTISNAAAAVVIAAQSAVMVAFSVFYLALLSRLAFLLTVVIAVIAFIVHYREMQSLTAAHKETQERQTHFFELLTGLLEGFKEVKMNRRRSDDLATDMNASSDSLARLKIATGERFARAFVFAQTVFYVLIATVVFILPRFNQADTPIVTKAAATILFIIGPLSNLATALPTFSAANVAVAGIERIEEALEQARSRVPLDSGAGIDYSSFETITLENVVYRYLDKHGQPMFTLGPIDLTIRRGETIFLIGGNGSGKSTLLKILTSLYYPHSGRILVDGRPLTPESYRAFRALYSPIFVDYHVFKVLYGLRPVDPQRASELLSLLEIEDKTAIVADRFTNTELSTGQRKRLAMLINLLEARPIQVLDEWAADQDPVYRRFFYEGLLRDLKADGRTVIAATHDDHYFHVADRVLRMENGILMPWSAEGGAPHV